MKDKISIIVPVYNVEKYLDRCVYTLLNQTYKNIEIILVDDGSKDSSGEICDKYLKDNNCVKVIHKENGGLSDARNHGIKKATGKYLCFIDSDDYIELDIIEKMYNKIKKDKSDICCCGKVLEYEKNNILVNNNRDFSVDNITGLKKMLTIDDIDNSACDKLFYHKLFDNIEFPVGRYFEDIGTIYKLFIKAKKISHIKNIGYHYFIRNNSISTESFSLKQLDALFFSKQTMDDVIKIYPQLTEEAKSYYFLELMTTLRKIKRADNYRNFKKDYKNIKVEFNKNFYDLLKNHYIPFYKKIMATMIYMRLFKLVEIFYKIISKKK